jgi:hypothetical protein
MAGRAARPTIFGGLNPGGSLTQRVHQRRGDIRKASTSCAQNTTEKLVHHVADVTAGGFFILGVRD